MFVSVTTAWYYFIGVFIRKSLCFIRKQRLFLLFCLYFSFMFLKKCIFEELCSVAFSTSFCYTWLILSFNITHCLRQHFRLLNISTLPPLSSGTVDEDSRQCVRQVPGNIHLQWDTTHWGHPEGAGRSLLLQGWQRGGGGCHQVHPCRCAV